MGKIEEIREKFVQRFEGLYQVFSRQDATGRGQPRTPKFLVQSVRIPCKVTGNNGNLAVAHPALVYMSSKTVQWVDKLSVKSGQEIACPTILEGGGRYGAAESLKFFKSAYCDGVNPVKPSKQKTEPTIIRLFSAFSPKSERIPSVVI